MILLTTIYSLVTAIRFGCAGLRSGHCRRCAATDERMRQELAVGMLVGFR